MGKDEISIDRAIEIATLAIHGLMEDDVEQAMEYFADTIELTKKEYRFFGISAEEEKSVILKEVKQDGYALQDARTELQADKEVVLEAVKQAGNALQYASEELQADKDVVLEAVKENGKGLRYASTELKDDIDVVLEAMKQDSNVLCFASEKIQKEVKENNRVNHHVYDDDFCL